MRMSLGAKGTGKEGLNYSWAILLLLKPHVKWARGLSAFLEKGYHLGRPVKEKGRLPLWPF